jgi:hypothetical protein
MIQVHTGGGGAVVGSSRQASGRLDKLDDLSGVREGVFVVMRQVASTSLSDLSGVREGVFVVSRGLKTRLAVVDEPTHARKGHCDALSLSK